MAVAQIDYMYRLCVTLTSSYMDLVNQEWLCDVVEYAIGVVYTMAVPYRHVRRRAAGYSHELLCWRRLRRRRRLRHHTPLRSHNRPHTLHRVFSANRLII